MLAMVAAAFDDWAAKARAVPIEREIERRGIKLKGRVGTDRSLPEVRRLRPLCGQYKKGALELSRLRCRRRRY
jgi:hypothetical protein